MQKKGSKFISIISMLNKTFNYHFNFFEVDEDTVHNFIKFFTHFPVSMCSNFTLQLHIFLELISLYIQIYNVFLFISFYYSFIYLFILLSLFTHLYVSSFHIDIGVIYIFFYIKIYKKTKLSYYQKANKKVKSVKQRINFTQHSPQSNTLVVECCTQNQCLISIKSCLLMIMI